MPPGKRRQSNAMLYTLITFIGLFVAATTVAVIYYVKAEELRTQANELQDEMDRLATREQVRTIGTIVGTRLPGQSSLGTMVEHFDGLVRLVKGGPIQATSAEVKVGNAMQAVRPILERARAYVALPLAEPNAADPNAPTGPGVEPDQVALTVAMNEVLAELEHTVGQRDAFQQQLLDLRNRFDAAITDMEQTKNNLTATVNGYYQQVQSIKTDYNDLRVLVEQNADEQVKTLLGQLDQTRADARQLNQDLLKSQAELNVAQSRLEDALTTVNKVQPPPDKEVVAFQPDGRIILVDDAAGIVRIDLGSDDRVYRGLTFAVYDKGAGIPRDAKPKAEVEVFAIDKRACGARILSSDRKNPITNEDLAANLIWDRGRENRFVMAGEFDLTGDGVPEYDAIPRIAALVAKWGGSVSDEVTARTDYVILGSEPKVPAEPTLEDLQIDPTAMDRYTAAQQRLERYEQIRQRAQALWIPIFNYDRFLHFTGYASQVGKPGAF